MPIVLWRSCDAIRAAILNSFSNINLRKLYHVHIKLYAKCKLHYDIFSLCAGIFTQVNVLMMSFNDVSSFIYYFHIHIHITSFYITRSSQTIRQKQKNIVFKVDATNLNQGLTPQAVYTGRKNQPSIKSVHMACK